jgi:uncharacterized protein YutE (UPF0331/DUF86 family)
MRNSISSLSGESTANKPISILIKELHNREILSETDEALLRELLDVRNRILHEGYEPHRGKIESMIKQSERLIKKINPLPDSK